MKKIIVLLLSTMAIGAISCKRDLPDPGRTALQNASNGWWVTVSIDGTPVTDPFFFSTYNTASNSDSIWLDDLANFWEFKIKTKIDYTNLTFSATQVENDYYQSQVTIKNGKIFPKAGHTASGTATDSLYMEASFSDETDQAGNLTPYATTFVISGTARTGFIEDDH